ncbi:MAG: NAD(P)-dependent alcohol dehydrogenase [Dehalococcoidia bacterium]
MTQALSTTASAAIGGRPEGSMLAARIHAYKQPLVIDEVPRPVAGPGQILVRVAGAGFCHSDLHILDGEIPILPRLPLILGHENAGYVAEIGAGVTSVAVGQPVVVFGGWGCGHCDYCVTGIEQLCATPGWAGLSANDGGYAEYILVPAERHLVPLARLDPAVAAPLTDAALTPYRAIRKAMPFLEPDHKALVIGVGGLGQYGIKLLRILTGLEVIAVDVSEEKLLLAEEYGAAYTVNATDGQGAEQVRKIAPAGVAVAFDFVGSDATLALALAATRSLGKVTQIGLAGGEARMRVLQTNPWEVLFETTIWGTIKELREVVALAESGRLTLIDTEFVPLAEITEVPARLKRGEARGRIVITP